MTQRVNLDMSDTGVARLEALSTQLELSKSDTIRKALSLMEFVIKEQADGAQILVQKGRLTQRLIVI